MNKDYIIKIFKENQKVFSENDLDIQNPYELYNYIADTISSNFMYDFNCDIDIDKLFSNEIKLSINNEMFIKITQTESDKIRNGIGVKTIDKDGYIERSDLISESDFVMLMNYYRFIKDNDIYDEFINQNGINNKDSFDMAKDAIEI